MTRPGSFPAAPVTGNSHPVFSGFLNFSKGVPVLTDTHELEFLAPDSLIPHPDNSMKHSDGQITQLVASFEQFGFNGVIVIDENNVVLAGHGRRMAAIRMGMERVPCLRRQGLTDSQKRAYIIADNQIGRNSEWDEEVLAQQLESLVDDGFDLETLGISAAALASIQETEAPTTEKIRDLEAKTDTAPANTPDLEKELADKAPIGLVPIVPIYAEHHEAFVIVCDNAVDEAWLRNKLGLEKPAQSYKSTMVTRCNVLTVAQLRERLQ